LYNEKKMRNQRNYLRYLYVKAENIEVNNTGFLRFTDIMNKLIKAKIICRGLRPAAFVPPYFIIYFEKHYFIFHGMSPDSILLPLSYMRRQRHCMLCSLCPIHADGETSNF